MQVCVGSVVGEVCVGERTGMVGAKGEDCGESVVRSKVFDWGSLLGWDMAERWGSRTNTNRRSRGETMGRKPAPWQIFFFSFLGSFFLLRVGCRLPNTNFDSNAGLISDPWEHGCFYTGQPPDVPMARCFVVVSVSTGVHVVDVL